MKLRRKLESGLSIFTRGAVVQEIRVYDREGKYTKKLEEDYKVKIIRMKLGMGDQLKKRVRVKGMRRLLTKGVLSLGKAFQNQQ